MENSLPAGRAQKGDSHKGAPRMIVRVVAKWNPSGISAQGDAWLKAVELAYSNYWASPQGQARKADLRAEVLLQPCLDAPHKSLCFNQTVEILNIPHLVAQQAELLNEPHQLVPQADA